MVTTHNLPLRIVAKKLWKIVIETYSFQIKSIENNFTHNQECEKNNYANKLEK